MHTKPISTEGIASYEAALTSGFAPLIIEKKDGVEKFVFRKSYNKLMDVPRPVMNELGNTSTSPLQELCQKMVNVLNDQDSLSEIDVLDNIESILEKNWEEEVTEEDYNDAHVLFQATVAYPYIRRTFTLNEAMAHLLQYQIIDNLDNPSEAMKNNLIKYFHKVDDNDKVTQEADPVLQLLVVGMRCRQNAIDSFQNHVKHVEYFEDFPSALLPNNISVDHNIFQETWKEIKEWKEQSSTVKFPNDYCVRSMELLLPFLLIFSKIKQPEVRREMSQEEKKNLCGGILAAWSFYETMNRTPPGREDRLRGNIEQSYVDNVKSMIDLLLKVLRDDLFKDVNGDEAFQDELLKVDMDKTEIYQFLLNYHNILKHFRSISAFGHHNQHDEREGHVSSLINFCNAFKEHGLKQVSNELLNKMENLIC